MLSRNEKLVERLSESYPMRRAAQYVAYLFHSFKAISDDSFKKFSETQMREIAKKGDRFKSTFNDELKKGFEKIKEDMKKSKQV
ncbi:unnamed protein product [Dimorphilus gyrociliatus]|uniref:Uncharacterized protein n=1 Tax=Dimorphilus gyrociliatus TaxID=2664684 RepID=A0A7I8VHV7_9ANNE|nr:unnamed protein product [Dimorphilus gyrociliatus]